MFHTTQTPTVCYSVPSIVEVSGGCQSVNIMSAQPRDYCSDIICILRKIHRLRKHPWISAQTMDDNGSIDCAGRSMDCADPQIAPNITISAKSPSALLSASRNHLPRLCPDRILRNRRRRRRNFPEDSCDLRPRPRV